jgi:transposase
LKKVYVGLDLGSTVCAAGAMDKSGRVLGKKEFPTSMQNLIECVKSIDGEVHVMFEEGEMSGWVCRALTRHVKRAVVCDPKRNAWIAKDSVKGDKVDAVKLADLLRMNSFKEVFHSQDEEMESFKKAVQLHVEMGRKVAALKSQLKAQFRREGVICKDRAIYDLEGSERALKKVSSPTVREVILQNYSLLEQMEKAKKKAESVVLSLSRRYPILSSFRKVPGMGPVLSARFVAYIQTPHRFRRRSKVWRYARLGVTDRTSDGKTLERKRLDREGNGILKDLSRKAFHAAMKKKEDNLFQRTYRRSLKTTQNAVHARLTTQRKILSVLWAMWRNDTEYDDGVDGHRA